MAGYYDPNPRKAFHNVVSERPSESFRTSLKIDWDMEWATLSSLTSYSDLDVGPAIVDLDDTDIDVLFDNGTSLESEVWTQDFQLTSVPGNGEHDSLSWLAGLSILQEQSEAVNSFFVFFPQPADQSNIDVDAYALFGEFTYSVSDKLSLTFGGRYSDESKDFFAEFSQAGGEEDWSNFSGKFVVQYYATEDVMYYLNVSQGFKSGGFNIRRPSNSFDPEEVTSYEVGVKSTLAQGQVKLNASAFYYDYEDMQVNQQILGDFGPELFIDNAGTSEIYGVDLELVLAPYDALLLGVNASYLQAEYSDDAEIIDARLTRLIPPRITS